MENKCEKSEVILLGFQFKNRHVRWLYKIMNNKKVHKKTTIANANDMNALEFANKP